MVATRKSQGITMGELLAALFIQQLEVRFIEDTLENEETKLLEPYRAVLNRDRTRRLNQDRYITGVEKANNLRGILRVLRGLRRKKD